MPLPLAILLILLTPLCGAWLLADGFRIRREWAESVCRYLDEADHD